jgi:hypothetical protein
VTESLWRRSTQKSNRRIRDPLHAAAQASFTRPPIGDVTVPVSDESARHGGRARPKRALSRRRWEVA